MSYGMCVKILYVTVSLLSFILFYFIFCIPCIHLVTFILRAASPIVVRSRSVTLPGMQWSETYISLPRAPSHIDSLV